MHVGGPGALEHGSVIEAVRDGVGLQAGALHQEQQLDSQHRLTVQSAQLHHHSVADLRQASFTIYYYRPMLLIQSIPLSLLLTQHFSTFQNEHI